MYNAGMGWYGTKETVVCGDCCLSISISHEILSPLWTEKVYSHLNFLSGPREVEGWGRVMLNQIQVLWSLKLIFQRLSLRKI